VRRTTDGAEVLRLLNPAFTGLVITSAASGFSELAKEGLPFAYCYLVLPLVLHAETRTRLPVTMATKLVTWTERNGDLVARFGDRVMELRPYTSKGILAATTGGLASMSLEAALFPTAPKAVADFSRQSGSPEVVEILKRAAFTGKWFAAAGTPATVLTALGVQLAHNS
jgi:hypothetical protein